MTEEQDNTQEGKKKYNIFITDDDKFLLDMYAVKFAERGYGVQTAFNGKDMLTKLEDGIKPDACLIDIVMPGMDGFELLERLKKEGHCVDVPVIILSNLGQKEDIERGVALGASGYIVKANATPTEVVNKLEEIMSKHQAGN